MIKSLLYVALLMGVSLCAMEERVERGKVSDERISAVLSLLLSKQQQSAAVEPSEEGGSPVKDAPKEISRSAGEMPEGSGGEQPGFPEFKALKDRIATLAQERIEFLELSPRTQNAIVEEVRTMLLKSADEEDEPQRIKRRVSTQTVLALGDSEEAASKQTGWGGGCLTGDLEKYIRTPGDRVKPPESTTPPFPHMP